MSAPVVPNLTVIDKRGFTQEATVCQGDLTVTAEEPTIPQPPTVRAKPLGNKVLLWRIPEPEGPLAIPDVAVEKPLKCKVVGVGTGAVTPVFDAGTRSVVMVQQPIPLEMGDEVYIRKWSGTEVKVEGHDLTVILLDDILLRL